MMCLLSVLWARDLGVSREIQVARILLQSKCSCKMNISNQHGA
ncbi:hypothetical protein [Kingella oralis]|nr:hypothetical protein [Kingella oralis]